MGLVALQAVNLGMAEVRFDEVLQVQNGGTLNQKHTHFGMRDGSTVELRLNSLSHALSGQGVFLDRLPQLVAARHAATGMR